MIMIVQKKAGVREIIEIRQKLTFWTFDLRYEKPLNTKLANRQKTAKNTPIIKTTTESDRRALATRRKQMMVLIMKRNTQNSI